MDLSKGKRVSAKEATGGSAGRSSASSKTYVSEKQNSSLQDFLRAKLTIWAVNGTSKYTQLPREHANRS